MKHKAKVQEKRQHSLVRADLWLAAALLLAALAAFTVIQCFIKKEGACAVITVDGRILHRCSLNEDAEITVSGYDGGKNTIIVSNGTVYMSDADCPDRLCVRMGAVSRTGETIVCLPHRVVVEVTASGKDQDKIDGVVR